MICMKDYRTSPASRQLDKFWEELKGTRAGVYTHTIKGRPNEVQSQMNMFYADLNQKCGQGNWRVLSTNSSPMPSGVCMYITYEVLNTGGSKSESEIDCSVGEHTQFLSVFGSKRNMESLNERIKSFHRRLINTCDSNNLLCLIDTCPEIITEEGYMLAEITYVIYENTRQNQMFVKEVLDDKEINAIGLAITKDSKKKDAKDTMKALENWSRATKIKL